MIVWYLEADQWLLTRHGGLVVMTSEHKSIQKQGGGFELGAS